MRHEGGKAEAQWCLYATVGMPAGFGLVVVSYDAYCQPAPFVLGLQ